jgi:Putative Flp pilus-assembly TadE/G-like
MRISRSVTRRSERGQIIIFVLIAVVFLLVIAGSLTSDVAKMIALKSEVQSSLDAAALAGAGKLGFDSTVFPTARDFVVNFAATNKTRNGTVTLNRNDANDVAAFNTTAMPYADVLRGVWDPTLPYGIGAGKRFAPSLDGTIVNSVMCRYKRQSDANFMSLWGLFQMNIAASAVATANPPATVPPDACLFPIAVGDCPFQGNTSLGCGAAITFITSSNQGNGAGCLAPPCSNTAAWASLEPSQDPTPPNIQQQITNAANGACTGSPLQTNNTIAVNNGMAQPTMDMLSTTFVNQFNSSGTVSVADSNGNTTYSGPGWKVYIPVIHSTSCPAQALTGTPTIVGWTEMVITQVIDKGKCAVVNHWNGGSNPWDPLGATPNCKGTNVPKNSGALRAVFGYYSYKIIPTNPVPTPTPRSALATKLRLVR